MQVGHSRIHLAVVLCTSLSALGACNGDGGGGGSESVVDDNTPGGGSTNNVTINMQSAAVITGAREKHSQGITGSGSLVAVVDSGIKSATDLVEQISGRSTSLGGSKSITDIDGHGTAMSSIIAANGDTTGVVGMAPDSKILTVRVDSNQEPGIFYTDVVAEGIDYAILNKADVINLSLGGVRADDIEMAISRAVRAGVMVAIGTGNKGSNIAPTDFASLVGLYGPTAVAVTAVDENNEIAYFAQPCDVYDPKFCMAAPGVNIAVLDLNGGTQYISGTSASTAVVSGAMALMREYFPDLTPAEIVEILLTTTDDLGDPGIDRVYGSGLLNIDKAMQPVGALTLSALDTTATLSNSTITAGSAFGDALVAASTFAKLGVKDAYRRDYVLDVTPMVAAEATDFDDLDLLAGMRAQTFEWQDESLAFNFASVPDTTDRFLDNDWRFNLNLTGNGNTQWNFAFSQGDSVRGLGKYNFTLVQSDLQRGPFQSDRDSSTSMGFTSDWGFTEFWALAELYDTEAGADDNSLVSVGLTFGPKGTLRPFVGLAAMQEDASVLGTKFTGVFGSIAQTTSTALTFGASYEVDRFDLFMAGNVGTASVKMADTGIIEDMNNIRFTAWSMGMGFNNLWAKDDRLSLGVSQPLKLERASLKLYDGSSTKLDPSGRQFNIELAYRSAWDDSLFGAGLAWVNDPNNIAHEEDFFQAGFLFEHRF